MSTVVDQTRNQATGGCGSEGLLQRVLSVGVPLPPARHSAACLPPAPLFRHPPPFCRLRPAAPISPPEPAASHLAAGARRSTIAPNVLSQQASTQPPLSFVAATAPACSGNQTVGCSLNLHPSCCGPAAVRAVALQATKHALKRHFSVPLRAAPCRSPWPPPAKTLRSHTQACITAGRTERLTQSVVFHFLLEVGFVVGDVAVLPRIWKIFMLAMSN